MKAISTHQPKYFMVFSIIMLMAVFLSTGSSLAAANRGSSASPPMLEWSMEVPMDIPVSEAAELGFEGARTGSLVPLVDKLKKAGVTFQQTPLLTVERGFSSRLKASGKGRIDDFRHILFRVMKPEFNPLGGVTEMEISGATLESLDTDLILEANPSTGYAWHLVTDGSFIERAPKVNEMVSIGFGLTQKQTLRLSLGSTATGSIKLIYRRAWEKEASPTRRMTLWLSSLPAELNLSDPNMPVAQQPYPAESYLKTTDLSGVPVTATPSSFDWRSQNIVTPVKDQGQCGSCWAFGTVSVMESAVLKAGGPVRDFSEQFLVSCNNDGYSCDGGYAAHKYHYDTLGKNQNSIGAVLEADKPYTATNGSCTTAQSHYEKLNTWAYVKSNIYNIATVDEIKDAIYTYGVVTTGVCVGNAFQAYTGGVFNTDEKSSCYSGGSYYANHLVSLVGWDDTGQYFIMKNSWGATGWGESGYMRIHYNISLIGQHLSWATVATSQIATPTFSPAAGTYSGSVTVTISSATSGATIRYTTDGSDPTSSSTAYSSALTFTTTTPLKAKAFMSGLADSDTASGTYTITSSLNLNTALDNSILIFSTGGNAVWFGQTSVFYYGGSAAQSGNITNNQVSWIQTTVTGPGSLSFNWRVSSETNYDYLRFYVDDVEQSGSISGNVGWQQKTFSILSGNHTLKWAYTKDVSISSGSDSGWLDKVEFTQNQKVVTPIFSPSPGTYTGFVSVTISCATSGATIRYTTDGTDPTLSSSQYISPLTFATTTVLRARAFRSGMTDSDMASGTYTITSPVTAPTVTTNAASGVTATSATLNGTVNPCGLSTSYYFEWGTTASYGNVTNSQSAGSGWANVAVSVNISGLGLSTTYHYRLVGTNSAGTTYGSDMTFMTLGPPVAATVISPSGTMALTSPTYYWYAVSNATQYNLLVNDSTGTKVNQSYTAVQAGCASGTGVCSANPSAVLALGIGNWQIQTQNSYGLGPWSSILNFNIVASAPNVDFNGDGKTDLLWRNKVSGDIAVWFMNGATLLSGAVIYQGVPLTWEIAGTGDFNNDGKTDILWRNKTTGDVGVWYMNGTTLISSGVFYQGVSLAWEIVGTGDFNNDGKTDILWRNKTTGDVGVWYMNGVTLISSTVFYQGVPLVWEIAGTGDFNNDGKTDILWRNKTTGDVGVWYMNGTTLISSGVFYQGVPLDWELYSR